MCWILALVCVLSVMMPTWAPVSETTGLPSVVDGHGQERDGDLLAGGQQHIHLPLGRPVGDLPGQSDQLVGGVPQGRDDDDDFVALGLSPRQRAAPPP